MAANQEVFIICNLGLCGFTTIIVTLIGLYQIYFHWNSTFIIKRERVLHLQFLMNIFLLEVSVLFGSIVQEICGRNYDSILYFILRMLLNVAFWSIYYNMFISRWLLFYNNNWILATMKS